MDDTMGLWRVEIDRWSTYIVVARDQGEAERLAFSDHAESNGGNPGSRHRTTVITPTGPGVVASWGT